jgi:hypothetical protein
VRDGKLHLSFVSKAISHKDRTPSVLSAALSTIDQTTVTDGTAVERVHQAAPDLPDGRRLLFTVTIVLVPLEIGKNHATA